MKQNNNDTLQFELNMLKKTIQDKHERALIAKQKYSKKRKIITVYLDTATEFKDMSIKLNLTHDKLLRKLMKGVK